MQIRKVTLLLLIAVSSLTGYAQDITGTWKGLLKVQGMQLRLVIHIAKAEHGFTSTMDSPDQGARGIPVTTTSFENRTLSFGITNAGIQYEGRLETDTTVVGTFRQAGQSFPLNLSRTTAEKENLVRPQEPSKPYPYLSEDIVFENKEAAITLAGTLTLPAKDGNYPAVVLITGSGPQNRDEEIMGHKPFLVLSDYLTRNGIAVLRYDDRGTGSSGGNFQIATSADFATDAAAAVNYLLSRKDINKKKIGLIGHSEGGVIAPMLAASSNDIAFLVLLAGTGVSGDQLLLSQQRSIFKASGVNEADLQSLSAINKAAFDIVRKSTNPATLKTDVSNNVRQVIIQQPESFKLPGGMSQENYTQLLVSQVTSPWMQYFIKYDPAITLAKVKCPVLAMNGEKDVQVPAKENLQAIREALLKGGNKAVITKELQNLNHLFQEAKTGLPAEYATIEQTISPAALASILEFVKSQTR